jgi:small basic protein (TIGR04137 family)
MTFRARPARHSEKTTMSLDASLKIKGGLAGKRSVLTRAERVTKLTAAKKINPKKDGALGLRKTRTK